MSWLENNDSLLTLVSSICVINAIARKLCYGVAVRFSGCPPKYSDGKPVQPRTTVSWTDGSALTYNGGTSGSPVMCDPFAALAQK